MSTRDSHPTHYKLLHRIKSDLVKDLSLSQNLIVGRCEELRGLYSQSQNFLNPSFGISDGDKGYLRTS